MASPEQAKAFRRRIGFAPDNVTDMPQEDVDEMFDQALEENPETPNQSISAVIIYLEGLFVNSAKLASFKKNNTTKNVSDIFEHIKDMLAYYKGALEEAQLAVDGVNGSVRSGKTMHRQRAIGYPTYMYPTDYFIP